MSPFALRSSSHAPGVATRVEAERIFRADVIVLIFEAEHHVDQRALVDHVVEAAAGIPAGVARRAVAVSATKVLSQRPVTLLQYAPLRSAEA